MPPPRPQGRGVPAESDDDAGEVVGGIPVPPCYTSADFPNSMFWQLHGALDMLRERFFSLPEGGHGRTICQEITLRMCRLSDLIRTLDALGNSRCQAQEMLGIPGVDCPGTGLCGAGTDQGIINRTADQA